MTSYFITETLSDLCDTFPTFNLVRTRTWMNPERQESGHKVHKSLSSVTEGENLKGPRWETLLGLRNHHDIILTGRTSVVLDRFVSTVCCPPVVTCCHCRHPVNHRTWNGVWCGSAQVQRWLGFITGPREAEPTHEARSGILVCIYLIEPVQVIPHDRNI